MLKLHFIGQLIQVLPFFHSLNAKAATKMGKRPLSQKTVSEYDPDDGFVEDAPKSKKAKTEPKSQNSGAQKDAEGNSYWEVRAINQAPG